VLSTVLSEHEKLVSKLKFWVSLSEL